MNFGRDFSNSQQSDYQDTPFFNKEKASIFDEQDEPEEDQAFKMFNPSKEKYMPSILSQLQDPQQMRESQPAEPTFQMHKNSNPIENVSGGRFRFREAPKRMVIQPFSFDGDKEESEEEPFQVKKIMEVKDKIIQPKWASKFSKNHNSEPLKLQFQKKGFMKKDYGLNERKNNDKPANQGQKVVNASKKSLFQKDMSLQSKTEEPKIQADNFIAKKEKQIQVQILAQKPSKKNEQEGKKKGQNYKLIEVACSDPIKVQPQSLGLLEQNQTKIPKFMQKNKFHLKFMGVDNKTTTTEPSSNVGHFNFSGKKQLFNKSLQKKQVPIKKQQVAPKINEKFSQSEQRCGSKVRPFKKFEFRNILKENSSQVVLENEFKKEQSEPLKMQTAKFKTQLEINNVLKKVEENKRLEEKMAKDCQSQQKYNQRPRIDFTDKTIKVDLTKEENKLVNTNVVEDKTCIKAKQSGLRDQLKKFGSRHTEKFSFKSLVQKVNPAESSKNQSQVKAQTSLRSSNFLNVIKQSGNSNDIHQQANQKIGSDKAPKFGDNFKKPQSAFIKTMVLLLQIGRQAENSRRAVLEKASSFGQLSMLLKECGERTNYLLNRHKSN